MAVTTHMCRGNFRSSWVAEGGYDFVAEALFNELEVDGFFMEWDDERSGGFEPLRFVPPGKQVVLGLVTTKSGELESKDELKRRIEEAVAVRRRRAALPLAAVRLLVDRRRQRAHATSSRPPSCASSSRPPRRSGDYKGQTLLYTFSPNGGGHQLQDAVGALVHDGDSVALEGFTHLIPFAAGHEIIRQGRRDLDAGPDDAGPDLRPDDRHGLRAPSSCSRGAATRASGRCTASATRSSTAGRVPLEVRSTATPAWPTATPPAPPLPFAVLRGYARHRSRARARNVTPSSARSPAKCSPPCPRCGRRHVVHAQRPTARATCSCGASSACRRRPCWPSARSIVTVEEIVDDLEPGPGDRAPVLGGDRRRRRRRAARSPRTRTATTIATTTSTGLGRDLRATATRSGPGWRSTCT